MPLRTEPVRIFRLLLILGVLAAALFTFIGLVGPPFDAMFREMNAERYERLPRLTRLVSGTQPAMWFTIAALCVIGPTCGGYPFRTRTVCARRSDAITIAAILGLFVAGCVVVYALFRPSATGVLRPPVTGSVHIVGWPG